MTRLLSILCLALVVASGCAKAPLNLTPEATAAFRNTQVITTIDVLRNFATAANAQTPPLLAQNTTRKVVLWHQASVNIITALPAGWKSTVLAMLDELPKTMSPAEQAMIEPYVTLARSVIQEVE